MFLSECTVVALSITTGTTRLYKEPLCCGSCPWIPHLSENISFSLLPFVSPCPPSNLTHYRVTVSFQGLQWTCYCSSFLFSNPGGFLDGAESPRKIIGVQISNKRLYLGSPASLFFLFDFFLQIKWNMGMKKESREAAVYETALQIWRLQTNCLRGIQEMLRCKGKGHCFFTP